jgi:hypothetical protein
VRQRELGSATNVLGGNFASAFPSGQRARRPDDRQIAANSI